MLQILLFLHAAADLKTDFVGHPPVNLCLGLFIADVISNVLADEPGPHAHPGGEPRPELVSQPIGRGPGAGVR